MEATLQQILERLSAIEAKLEGGAAPSGGGGGGGGGSDGEDARQIRAYDEYCRTFLDPFTTAAAALGGGAATAGELVAKAWGAQREFLVMASKCKKPDQAARVAKLQTVQAVMGEVGAAVQRGDWENHLKAVNEGVQALNWLAVEPAPRDFVENFIGGSDFWANKIRTQYRRTNPEQVTYCDTFKTLIQELMAYIKEYHTTGVTWNPSGGEVADYAGGAPAPAPAAAAPAPAPAAAAPAPAAPAEAKGGLGNVFSALNQGGSVTSGLKKVTRDMQTWRAEYKGGDAPAPAAKKPAPAARPAAKPQVKGPPVCEFQAHGMKWVVENQTKEQGVVEIQVTEIRQTVYVYGCFEATINVTGKCKSVVVDSCKRTKVLFDDVVSSCEVVNCQRMQIQARLFVPTVAVDKTDGILIYLPANPETTIVASKSSEMNVSFPNDEGDMIEKPIPEQFVSRVVRNGNEYSVASEVSDLYSS